MFAKELFKYTDSLATCSFNKGATRTVCGGKGFPIENLRRARAATK